MNLFRVKNIPVKLHISFTVLATLYVAYQAYHGGVKGGIFAAALGIMLFGSVILHEFGHALAAKRFGIGTRAITLYPFGGIALIEGEPPDSRSEFFIAIAGPAVNVAIALLMVPLVMLHVPLAADVFLINVIMGVFNLIPAFPMDGGRVLRALLMLKYDREEATRLSLHVTRVIAYGLLGLGLFYNSLNLIFIGVFLLFVINSIRDR